MPHFAQVSRHLKEPGAIRGNVDPDNLHRASFHLGNDEHHVPDDSKHPLNLATEEVAGVPMTVTLTITLAGPAKTSKLRYHKGGCMLASTWAPYLIATQYVFLSASCRW